MLGIKLNGNNLWGMLIRLLLHLSAKRRKQYVYILLLSFLSGIVEIISLGAVVPFIGVLTVPEVVFKYEIIQSLSNSFGITSAKELILPITMAFIFAILLASGIRLLLLWGTNQLSYSSAAELSIKAFKNTIHQPYSIHVLQNSSEVINVVTNKVGGIVGMIYACINLINASVLVIFLMSALFAMSPEIAGSSIVVFGISYMGVAWFARIRLRENSKVYAVQSTAVIKNLQEALGGIRDIILDGTQKIYCDTHFKSDSTLRRALASNNFIGGSPRFVMEAVVMVAIAMLAYFLTEKHGGLTPALPLLGAMAIGAQRMLPALQQIYISWSSITGGQASIDDALQVLDLDYNEYPVNLKSEKLPFKNNIKLDNVWFRYSDESNWIIKGIDLTIKKGEVIGFIGSTGCGKSTILDILMGLLNVTKGNVLIDEKPLTDTCCQSWQNNIAHVPQNIYLSDSTILENIAFGVPYKEIDFDRVVESAEKAQVSSFIDGLTEKYNTKVGERGIRLSGGQKQRIGIARALYKDANILVLDEATSALDNATELEVMTSIVNLSEELTIFLIAHRLTTLKGCDKVIELNDGVVISQGTYDEVINNGLRKDANF